MSIYTKLSWLTGKKRAFGILLLCQNDNVIKLFEFLLKKNQLPGIKIHLFDKNENKSPLRFLKVQKMLIFRMLLG